MLAAALLASGLGVQAASGVDRVYLFNELLNTNSGTGAPYASFGAIRANASGQVAISAAIDSASGGGRTILRLEANGSLTTVIPSTFTNSAGVGIRGASTLPRVDINNAGTVAALLEFNGSSNSQRARGIYTGSGAAITTIAEGADGATLPTSIFTRSLEEPRLDASGKVFFSAQLDAGGTAIYSGDGLSLTQLANSTTTTFDNGAGTFDSLSIPPVVLPDGSLHFTARRDPFGNPILDGIYRYDAATGAITTVADDTAGALVNNRIQTGGILGNRSGDAVGYAFAEDGSGAYAFYQLDADGTLTVLGTNTSANVELFGGGSRLSDDGGDLLVAARPIGSPSSTSIYDGLDGDTDLVATVGTPMLGGTVTGINGSVSDIAPNGDIYFVASIDNTGDVVTDFSALVLADARIPGDANGNDVVEFADLVTLAQNYGQNIADFNAGDFDFNGTIGFTDLVALAQNYGLTLDGLRLASVNDFSVDFARAFGAVPEPATLGLVAAAGLVLTRRRRA